MEGDYITGICVFIVECFERKMKKVVLAWRHSVSFAQDHALQPEEKVRLIGQLDGLEVS